jgi:hypothetical protein
MKATWQQKASFLIVPPAGNKTHNHGARRLSWLGRITAASSALTFVQFPGLQRHVCDNTSANAENN